LKRLSLLFQRQEPVDLDSCLDVIVGLDHITYLSLYWNRISLDKIKTALRNQGGKKRWEFVSFGVFERELNDDDILEVCYYLPSLREWTLFGTRFTITVEGAREWKRICPNLISIRGLSGGLSEEVMEGFQGLGVTIIKR
jgi:hypothetical protein